MSSSIVKGPLLLNQLSTKPGEGLQVQTIERIEHTTCARCDAFHLPRGVWPSVCPEYVVAIG